MLGIQTTVVRLKNIQHIEFLEGYFFLLFSHAIELNLL